MTQPPTPEAPYIEILVRILAQAIDAPKILVGILDLGIDATKILGGILAPALDAIEILVGILATRAPPAWSARPDLGRSGHPPTKCPEVRVAEHATKLSCHLGCQSSNGAAAHPA